jgi:hypothetical protein
MGYQESDFVKIEADKDTPARTVKVEADTEKSASISGWLKKKGNRLNTWRQRYFMLQDDRLTYFHKETDAMPRGTIYLNSRCKLEMREVKSGAFGKDTHFEICIYNDTHGTTADEAAAGLPEGTPLPPVDLDPTGGHAEGSKSSRTRTSSDGHKSSSTRVSDEDTGGSTKSTNSSERRRKKSSFGPKVGGAAGAMGTLGMVLAVAMPPVGVPLLIAGGAGASAYYYKKSGEVAHSVVTLAADTLELAQEWRDAIEGQIRNLQIREDLISGEEGGSGSGRRLSDLDGSADTHTAAATPRATVLTRKGSCGEIPKDMASHPLLMESNFNKDGSPRSRKNSDVSADPASPSSMSPPSEVTRKLSGAFPKPGTNDDTHQYEHVFDDRWRNRFFEHGLVVQENTERREANPNSWPMMRMSTKIRSTPSFVFSTLMQIDKFPRICGFRVSSARVVQKLDDHSDIIHIKFLPVIAGVRPRDLCLQRYWRFEDNGSFDICWNSTTEYDEECPLDYGVVRAEIVGGGYTIRPLNVGTNHLFSSKAVKRKPEDHCNAHEDDAIFKKHPELAMETQYDIWAIDSNGKMLEVVEPQCLVTCMFQFNPKGGSGGLAWALNLGAPSLVPLAATIFGSRKHIQCGNLGLDDAYSVVGRPYAMMMADLLVCIRGYLQEQVFKSPTTQQWTKIKALSPEEQVRDRRKLQMQRQNSQDVYHRLSAAPLYIDKLMMDKASWEEPSASLFPIRAVNYLEDGCKAPASDTVFSLARVELFETSQPTQNLCGRDDNVVHRWDEPFIFVLQMMIPGPPFKSVAFYFVAKDRSFMDDGSAYAEQCHRFFCGDDDEFRNKTFKLIPSIVEGHWAVRAGVGKKPVILGTKIKHRYHKGPNFFEIDCDLGEDRVAAGVLKLVQSYTSTLVVDLGFVLEGGEPALLPERLLGCVRVSHLDLNAGKLLE